MNHLAAGPRQIAGKPAPTPYGQKLRVLAKPLVILPEGRGSQLAGEIFDQAMKMCINTGVLASKLAPQDCGTLRT